MKDPIKIMKDVINELVSLNESPDLQALYLDQLADRILLKMDEIGAIGAIRKTTDRALFHERNFPLNRCICRSQFARTGEHIKDCPLNTKTGI